MALPDIETLVRRAKEIAKEAEDSELSLDDIYKQLEKEHKLKKGALTHEYKTKLKTEIGGKVALVESDAGDETEAHERDSEDEDVSYNSDSSEPDATPIRKAKKHPTPTSKSSGKTPAPQRKAPRSMDAGKKKTKEPASRKEDKAKAKQYLSKEFVDTEDEDGDDHPPVTSARAARSETQLASITPASSKTGVRSHKASPKKPIVSTKSQKEDEEGLPKPKAKPGLAAKKARAIENGRNGGGQKDDADMSESADSSPARNRKEKKSTSTSEPRKRSRKLADSATDKDEAQIKKLKSLVLACGVRKVWVKEFRGLDTPSQQIARLRDILRELGMTGRLSVEQARAIREKRELAQELQDVQAFDKAVNSRSSRSRSAAEAKSNSRKRSREEEEGSESDADILRTRKSAKARIAEFLADQSEDE